MSILCRKKTLYLALILLLSGCGQHNVFIIETEFQPYYDRFLNTAKSENVSIHMDNLIIKLSSDLPILEMGLCTQGDGLSTVRLSDKYWNNLTDAGKEQLMFHELGHCILRRSHLDTILPSGIPESIMNKDHMDDITYLQNHQYYLDELFHP